MKAFKIYKHGGPEVLQLEDVNIPKIQANEVLVKNTYLGVNFVDTQHRAGHPYPIDLPLIPGIEAVGTIEQVGSEVTGFEPGQRVGYAGYMGGNYAEFTPVDANALISIPNEITDEQAAASLLQGMTAHCLTENAYQVRKGDSVLIHGGAGGVGHFLIQMCKHKGAQVFTTVSSDQKADLVEQLEADHIINYKIEDFELAIRKQATDGLEVVYDSVGKATFDKGLNLLKAKGHMVIFGLSSGPIDPFNINRLSGITGAKSKGSLFLTWATLSDYNANVEEMRNRAKKLFDWMKEGKVKPHIHATLPFENAPKAHELLESRKVLGKVLLKV